MINVEDYKKALGREVDGMTEEEIAKAMKVQDELAEIFFVMWMKKRKKEVSLGYNIKICEQIQSSAI